MRGDVSKLPKWAQSEIQRLTANLASAYETLQAGPENSNTFTDPYGEGRRPLGDSPTVEFVLADGLKMRVRADGDRLDISGYDSILVAPRASNSIEVVRRPR